MQPYQLHRRKAHSFSNGYSVQFDGVNEHIVGGTAGLPSGSAARSFSFWVKVSANNNTLFDYGEAGFPKTVQGKFGVNGDASWIEYSGTAILWNTLALSQNTWYNVVFTFPAGGSVSNWAMYVNNVAQAFLAGGGGGGTNTILTNGILLGYGRYFPTYMNGKMDEVSVWDKQLTAGDLTALYNTGKPANLLQHPSSANLKCWWRMGDGDTFNIIEDRISGNNGTMTNAEAGDIQTDVP